MVFAFAIEDDILSFLIIYCVMPVFVFFLTYTLAVRERDTKLHLREIMHKFIRSLFD